jgi:hypothetical protein
LEAGLEAGGAGVPEELLGELPEEVLEELLEELLEFVSSV